MTNERIRKKALDMYDDGTWGSRQISLGKAESLKLLRHEDKQLGGSGYWVDCAVFVPDDEPDDEASLLPRFVLRRKALP